MKKKLWICGLTILSLMNLSACGTERTTEEHEKQQHEVKQHENKYIIQAKKNIENNHFNQAKHALNTIVQKKAAPDKKEAQRLINQINTYEKAWQYMQNHQWTQALNESKKVTKINGGSNYLVKRAKTIMITAKEQETLIHRTDNEKNALYNAQENINQQNFYAAKDQLAIAKKDDQLTSEAEQIEAQIDHYLSAQTALNEQQLTKAQNEAEAVCNTSNGSSQMKIYAEQLIDQVRVKQEHNKEEKLNRQAQTALYIAKDDIRQCQFQDALYELTLAEKSNHNEKEAHQIKLQLNHYLTAYSAYRYGKYSEAINEIKAIKAIPNGDETIIAYANHLLYHVQHDEAIAQKEQQQTIKAGDAMIKAKDNIIHQNFYMAQKELNVAIKDSAYTKEAKVIKQQIEYYLKAYDLFDKEEYKQAIKEAKEVRYCQNGDSQLFAYADQLIHDCQMKLKSNN